MSRQRRLGRWMVGATAGFAWTLAACGPSVIAGATDGDTESGSSGTTEDPDPSTPPTSTSTTTTTAPPSTVTTVLPTTASSSGGSESSGSSGTTGGPAGCEEGDCRIDIVVVVDNSANTAGAQQALALGMVELEAQLRGIGADFQVMFTTTDFGNPLCTPFEPDGYEPSRGSPVDTACTTRLADFTGLGSAMVNAEEACTNVCPEAIGPIDDPFVASDGINQNVPELTQPVDIDGDGEAENEVARALACLAPMGISGCGYESPLENMLQALNPSAAWNQGPRPFLRDGASLGVVLLTDEYDCSVSDYSMMSDVSLMETSPTTGDPMATSALCWNAGADCEGPGPDGTYDCSPVSDSNLHPVTRYTSYLEDTLAADLGKPVYMLGLLGVPAVTDHLDQAPFTPTAGGILDLEIRDWADTDILPEDAAAGVTTADRQFLFGIGPSCSRPESTSRQQGIPPVRIAEVCDGLSGADSQRCCIESICDDDYAAGMQCLVGMLQAG